jgi:hypothetical protein
MPPEKFQSLLLDLHLAEHRRLDTPGQTRAQVCLLVPLVHAAKHLVGLMNHPGRRFRNDVEIGVGDDHGQFDDLVRVRIETGHFHIQPYQRILILCHRSKPPAIFWIVTTRERILLFRALPQAS